MYTIYTVFFRRLKSCVAKFFPVRRSDISHADGTFKRQLLMSIKLTTVLMITFLLQASASSKAQNISLTGSNIPIKSVFKEIRKQTGYNVFWEQDKLNASQRLNIHFKQASLDQVMKKCLEGQPLTYTIDNNTIVIKPEQGTMLRNIVRFFTDLEIKGTVKGTKTWYKTDEQGHFRVRIQEGGAVLVISYLGYQTREIEVKKAEDLQITMVPAHADLSE
eukprot:gene17566-21019_t